MQFSPDRFYLNTSPYLDHADGASSGDDDECGKNFSRSAYLKQIHASEENIQCVIFSTYRLDWAYMQEEFPLLFDSSLAIPCLVLHGEKREDEQQWWSKYADSEKVMIEDETQHEVEVIDDLGNPTSVLAIPIDGKVANANMQVREVIPQYDFKDGDIKLLNSRSRFMAGVHHPKYILIFTDDGLHVCISTANLTKNGSVDASWVQFFPRCAQISSSSSSPESQKQNNSKVSDFGFVLQDFIEKQSQQLRKDPSSDIDFDIFSWIESHCGIRDMEYSFDFRDANVDLVSTVPGRIPLPELSNEERGWLYKHYQFDMDLIASHPCEKCRLEQMKLSAGSSSLRYGSLRMKDLLLGFNAQQELSQHDVLLLQPTSIGLGIDNSFVGTLLEHYLPEDIWEEDVEYLRQESWRLIWPSRQTMIDIYRNATASSEEDDTDIIDDEESEKKESPRFAQGLLFLHARNFSLMEPDIQSQFYTYSPSNAKAVQNLSQKHVPHIKSYCRVATSSSSKLVSESREPPVGTTCSCYPLRWTLITSACLSRGAQGIKVPYTVCSQCRHIRQGYWDYKNFELGVFFKSSSNRQYKGLYERCPFHGQTHQPQEFSSPHSIILPFPYDLMENSSPFCDEVGKMQNDLFFHPPSPNITTKYPDICTDELKEQVKMKRAQSLPLLRSKSVTPTSLIGDGPTVALGKRSFSLANVSKKSTSPTDVSEIENVKKRFSFPLPSKKSNSLPVSVSSTGIAFVKQLLPVNPTVSQSFQSLSIPLDCKPVCNNDPLRDEIIVDQASKNSSKITTSNDSGSIVDFLL